MKSIQSLKKRKWSATVEHFLFGKAFPTTEEEKEQCKPELTQGMLVLSEKLRNWEVQENAINLLLQKHESSLALRLRCYLVLDEFFCSSDSASSSSAFLTSTSKKKFGEKLFQTFLSKNSTFRIQVPPHVLSKVNIKQPQTLEVLLHYLLAEFAENTFFQSYLLEDAY